MNRNHRTDDYALGTRDRLIFDASFGVVQPRVGGGAVGSAWAIAGALLALALLVGAVVYPIATEMPHFRTIAEP
jgi:hypothetical protein